jgi:F0F1-type ATP synthase delta subunit
VLFTVASTKEVLNLVLEDMQFFRELNRDSEEFRNFLGNSSFKRSQQTEVINSIGRGNLSEITNNFLDTLIENKRLDQLPKVA